MAEQAEQIEQSSGAWTRTRTTQLQRLVRCQLRYAGSRAQNVMGHYLERSSTIPAPDPVAVSKDFLGYRRLICLYAVRSTPSAMLAAAQPSILR
jgi:hypothetical protein